MNPVTETPEATHIRGPSEGKRRRKARATLPPGRYAQVWETEERLPYPERRGRQEQRLEIWDKKQEILALETVQRREKNLLRVYGWRVREFVGIAFQALKQRTEVRAGEITDRLVEYHRIRCTEDAGKSHAYKS